MGRKANRKNHRRMPRKIKKSKCKCYPLNLNDEMLEVYECKTPKRCLLFVIGFWSFAIVFVIALMRLSYFIPLSLSDANIIRFGTTMQDYSVGETSSLQQKRDLQRNIISQKNILWFLSLTIVPFIFMSIFIRVSKLFKVSEKEIRNCEDFFCAKNVYIKKITPIIYSYGLSIFGVLVTVFSLWSGAL